MTSLLLPPRPSTTWRYLIPVPQAGWAALGLSSSSSGELSPAPSRCLCFARLTCPPEQRSSTRLPRLVQKAPARARPGAVRTANVKLGVPALLAYVDLWDVRLADLGAGEVDPGVALVALNHRPPGKRLHAEASDQVPGIVIWKEEQQVTFLSPGGSPVSFSCTENSLPSDLS